MADQVFDQTEQNTADQPVVTPEEGTTQVVAPNPLDEILKGIVKEDGSQKYSSPEAALSSIAPAQAHIVQIEAENARLRAEAEKAKAVEEYLNKVPQQSQGEVTAPPSEVDPTETITNVVQNALQGMRQQEIYTANIQTVNDSLVTSYGDAAKAKEAVQAKAAELGMSIDVIKDMSAKSPNAVLAWFNNKQATTPTPVQSDVNTQSFNQTNTAQQQAYKTVMGPASSQELISAWKQSGERVRANLGDN